MDMSANKICFIYFLLIALSCFSQKSKTNYLKDVGDIKYDKTIDDSNFKICDTMSSNQYYSFSEGFRYVGDKSKIIETFRNEYKSNTHQLKTGYITIRFLINCEGKSGLFRIHQMDMNYLPSKFDDNVVNQLLSITKSLDGWVLGEYKGKIYDYYQYLTFKIINNKLIEILP
jgi:hypothetical protein